MLCAVVILAIVGPLSASQCGQRPSNARIVGGQEAVPHSWPWQLSLRKYGRHNCGASLIFPQWALTAGHCVRSSLNPDYYSVFAGAHDRYGSEGKEYKISKIILHKDYSHVFNDVALLKLEKPAELNDKVGLICLPKQGDRVPSGATTNCYISGWGRYDPSHNSGSSKLKQTYVPIADHRICRNVNGGSVREDTMICVGGAGSSACNGDSGGPLSCLEGGRWVLRGASSWVTDRKCPGNTYSVYARVSQFINWIYQNTGEKPLPSGPPNPPTPPSPQTPPRPRPTTSPGICKDDWPASHCHKSRCRWFYKACKKTCNRC